MNERRKLKEGLSGAATCFNWIETEYSLEQSDNRMRTHEKVNHCAIYIGVRTLHMAYDTKRIMLLAFPLRGMWQWATRTPLPLDCVRAPAVWFFMPPRARSPLKPPPHNRWTSHGGGAAAFVSLIWNSVQSVTQCARVACVHALDACLLSHLCSSLSLYIIFPWETRWRWRS
jgi:hypothetical protein